MSLKPCPCCGGEAEFVRKSGSWGFSSPTLGVRCTSCGLNIPQCAIRERPMDIDVPSETLMTGSLLALWNNRPDKESSE